MDDLNELLRIGHLRDEVFRLVALHKPAENAQALRQLFEICDQFAAAVSSPSASLQVKELRSWVLIAYGINQQEFADIKATFRQVANGVFQAASSGR